MATGSTKRRKPPGRKPTLTPEVERALLKAIEKGLRPEAAADALGVARSTWWRWTNSELPRYRALQNGIARARARDEQELVERVRSASKGTAERPGDWRAAMRLLEVARPEVYGPTVHVTAKVESELAHGLERASEHFDPATYRKLLWVFAGARGPDPSREDRDEGEGGGREAPPGDEAGATD